MLFLFFNEMRQRTKRSRASSFFALFFAVFIFLGFTLSTVVLAHKGDSPKVWNLSHQNFFFVGREDVTKQIDSFFKKNPMQILALMGGPGFGKTQLAKHYALQSCSRYDVIWWMDASQDLAHQLEELALALNTILSEKEKLVPAKLSKEALAYAVKNTLRLKKIKYLLIFDNTTSYDQIERFIPYSGDQRNKDILITSRNASLWPTTIGVGKFKRPESVQFIQKEFPKEKTQAVENLAKTLDDYPLGLAIAAGFIKAHPTTDIEQYIALHLKRTLQKSQGLKPPSNAFLNSYASDAQTPLSLSLKAIEEQSAAALKVLFFMSLLNSKDIPLSYVDSWLKNQNSKGKYHKAPFSLTSDEAIRLIHDQSLVDVSKRNHQGSSSNSSSYFLSLHDLIHELIREELPMDEKRKLIEQATLVMLDVFSGPSEVFTKKIIKDPIHLLHAQKLCHNAKAIEYSSSSLLQLKVCMLECLMGGLRDFDAAKLLLEDIEHDLKAGFHLAPYYEALLKMNKGFFESLFPHFDEAIQYMTEGLALLDKLEGYPEERLRAITNLIQYYTMRGEADLASELIETGIGIAENLESPLYNCFFIWAHSLALNDQGKFEEALHVLDKATRYPELSTNYPTIEHFILLQKIGAFIKQKNFDKAWDTLRDCEKKTKEFFQERKTTIRAHIFLYKSYLLIQQKKSISQALQYLKEARNIYNGLFQGEKQYRHQGREHFMKGQAYEAKRDFQKALKEYLISKEIYDEVLKSPKIDDVSELYATLVLLGIELKDDALARKYFKTHLAIFGLQHPRTQTMMEHFYKRGLILPL